MALKKECQYALEHQQREMAAMKADRENAMPQQFINYQNALSQKEAAHLADQDEARNAHETEKQTSKLLSSDKEALQRELLQMQTAMREAHTNTENKFKMMEEQLAAQTERKQRRASFKSEASSHGNAHVTSAQSVSSANLV